MKYEVKYCVKYDREKHDLFSVPFPTIRIKYRRSGSLLWTKYVANLDSKAYDIFYNRDGKTTYYSFIESASVHRRLTVFLSVLESNFNNNMDDYVAWIVRDIVEAENEKNGIEKTNEDIIFTFVTEGWKTLSVDVDDKYLTKE